MSRSAHCAMVSVTLCAVLAGCVSAPDVARIPPTIQQSHELYGDEAVREGITPWWTQLNDVHLDQLIRTGLSGSPSSAAALARLNQAEQNLKIEKSARWPSVFGRGSRESINFNGSEVDTRTDVGALELSWDAGLWGRRKLEIQAAQQFREQRWFEHQSVELALSTSIAEIYYEIIEQRTQGQLIAAQVEVSVKLEKLIEARFRLGQAPANELYQQREQTAVLKQLKLVSDTRQELLEMSLDALLGRPPDTKPRVTRIEVPEAPATTGLGTPEELIRHRADIRAGYARLRQAAARVGIRFAERLPSLQVTASLTSLTDKATSAEWFGHGLNLALPIFAGGQLLGLEKRERFVLEEERQRYLELWLTALEEVSTLRWQYQQQQKIIGTLSARRGFAQSALEAARNRYTLGDQNYLDVLTALRGLQEADRSLVSERRLLITLWIRATESIGQRMCDGAGACESHWQL